MAVSYKELINKTSPQIAGRNSLGDATIFINRGSPNYQTLLEEPSNILLNPLKSILIINDFLDVRL